MHSYQLQFILRYDKEAGCSKRPDNVVNILRYWIFVLTMLLRIMYFEEDQVDCLIVVSATCKKSSFSPSTKYIFMRTDKYIYVHVCSLDYWHTLKALVYPSPPVQNHPWPNFNWRFYNPMPVLLSRKFATWPSIRTHFLLPTCLYLSSRQSFLQYCIR